MGKMKEFWMEKCDEVIDEYYRGVITYKEARSKLKTLNASPDTFETLEYIHEEIHEEDRATLVL